MSLIDSQISPAASFALSHIVGPPTISPGITLDCGRFHHRNVSELLTTLTLENAIAAPAIIGWRCTPHGRNTPMASGMPMTLYMHAQTRLRRMTLKIELERCRAATTSSRSERISTMSAASIATDVPDDRAIPTVAATSAGESLMPSPTYRSRSSLSVSLFVNLLTKVNENAP
jgi:hypothetical protein